MPLGDCSSSKVTITKKHFETHVWSLRFVPNDRRTSTIRPRRLIVCSRKGVKAQLMLTFACGHVHAEASPVKSIRSSPFPSLFSSCLLQQDGFNDRTAYGRGYCLLYPVHSGHIRHIVAHFSARFLRLLLHPLQEPHLRPFGANSTANLFVVRAERGDARPDRQCAAR